MSSQKSASFDKVNQLISAIEGVYPSTKKLMWKSFLRGVFFGLGTTIGVSIVVAVLSLLLSALKSVPFFDQIIIQTNVERVFSE